MKAIAESTGREMKKIKTDYAETGDLGVIAMVSISAGSSDLYLLNEC